METKLSAIDHKFMNSIDRTNWNTKDEYIAIMKFENVICDALREVKALVLAGANLDLMTEQVEQMINEQILTLIEKLAYEWSKRNA